MIYPITLVKVKQKQVEELLAKYGYSYDARLGGLGWKKPGVYNNNYINFTPDHVESKNEKFSITIDVPDTPKYEQLFKKYGLKKGVEGRHQKAELSVLENILRDFW
ncbi:hypothetical protein HZA33_02430 [Candidatus Pacearchaeota archaeon]|nr:hypothetical protein [Candidatus Pacearchaeota archaeon]